jgi:multimeric flavodoxin WrbA
MKVFTIMGSPRRKGNTAAALRWLEEELEAKAHEIDRADIADYRIAGCLGCYHCQKHTAQVPVCIQEDDLCRLYERLISADAVVYATPLYFWGFSGQMKPFIDRALSCVTGYGGPNHKTLMEGKRYALLVTCAGPIDNNADLIVQAFRRIARHAKCEIAGETIIPFCSAPERLGDEARSQIRELAAKTIG